MSDGAFISCGRYPCGAHTGGCYFSDCINHRCAVPPAPVMFPSVPSPRFLPVNMPIPTMGFTIAVMDSSGNVILKTEQSESPFASAERAGEKE